MELTKEEAVRPAAEYLLLAVIDDHTAVGVPTLLQILASVESTPLASCTVDQLYLLDAVYQVMGLSVHKLAFLPEPQFSFPAWFSKSLLPIINVCTRDVHCICQFFYCFVLFMQSAASPSQPLPYRVLLRR